MNKSIILAFGILSGAISFSQEQDSLTEYTIVQNDCTTVLFDSTLSTTAVEPVFVTLPDSINFFIIEPLEPIKWDWGIVSSSVYVVSEEDRLKLIRAEQAKITH